MTHRFAFQKMLEDVKNKKGDVIVSYKSGRLTRSVRDLKILITELEKYDCSLECASRFFVRMLTILSTAEIEMVSEKVELIISKKL